MLNSQDITFIGTPEFSATILEGLINNGLKPSLVITSPDKPKGREKALAPSEVKKISQKYNIPLSYNVKDIKGDLTILAAFGQILDKKILDKPRYGSLNVHPSLLPKYRGPSPIQTTILNGDKEAGITIYLMDEKVDHGPIIASAKLPISDKITYPELSQNLAHLSIGLLLETIPKWIGGEIKEEPQDESQASYTKLLKKEDAKIDWSKPALDIERQIRAFDPWPGSFTLVKKEDKTIRVKILEAKAVKIDRLGKLCVKCAKNYLLIKKLQPEGKKPMKAEDFLKGNDELNIIF